MKVELPTLEFSADRNKIRANRDLIKETIAAYQGAIKAMQGLASANSGMCRHPTEARTAHYDPGYAGGGYSHTDCEDCGGRVP